jgi:WD40 repeat protein
MSRRATGTAAGAYPDPTSISTRAEFGAAIDALRERSGLAYRDVERRIDVRASTLGGWIRGRHVPYKRTEGQFVRALQLFGVTDPAPWLEAASRVRSLPAETSRDRNPYLGLASFGVEDGDRFFGRDGLVEHAVRTFATLDEGDADGALMILVGSSGSGKSSLLHAGLQRQLVMAGHSVVTVRPGAQPLSELATALSAVAGLDVVALEAALWQDGGPAVAVPEGTALLVDQLEELFTLAAGPGDVARFVALLASPGDRIPGLRTVAALRADFFGPACSHPPLRDALQRHQIVVGPMSRDEMQACIVGPARQAGLNVSVALVDVLLRDFSPPSVSGNPHGAASLPLLSHVLHQMAATATGLELTTEDYRRVGGVDRAVELAAEEAYGALDQRERRLLRRMIPRLVNLGPGAAMTRRPVPFDELEGLATDVDGAGDDVLGALLDRLTSGRILSVAGDDIELTHEALLTAWPRLREWVEEDRVDMRVGRQLAEATALWRDLGGDRSALLTGTRLEAVTDWVASGRCGHVNDHERRFLEASVEQRDTAARVESRRRARLRALVAVTSILAVAASAFAVMATRAGADAKRERDRATSRQMAVSATGLRASDPSLAATMSLAAFEISATVSARSQLLESTAGPRTFRLLGHVGPAALATSSDGSLVAVANGPDATVHLLQVAASTLQRVARIGGHQGAEVYAIDISPDGGTLAVGDSTGATTLHDITDPARPARLAPPFPSGDGPIWSVRFAGAGHLLVGTGDGLLRWDLTEPTSPRSLSTVQAGDTRGIDVSSDGRLVATAGADGHVRLWDLAVEPPSAVTAIAPLVDTAATSVAFSPDGALLAAGYKNRAVRVYRVDGAKVLDEIPAPATEFTSWVNTVAFDSSGGALVAGNSDGAIRMWDTASWQVLGDVRMPGVVSGTRFLPNGDLAAVAYDGSIRLWDLTDQSLEGLDAPVWGLAYSADGSRLAGLSGLDAAIWDTADDANARALNVQVQSGAGGAGFSGAGSLSVDGTMLAAGTRDGAVELIDVSDAGSPVLRGRAETGSDELVEMVTFGPDGLLAAASDDGRAHLWDVSDPTAPVALAPVDAGAGAALAVAMSSDGRLAALGTVGGGLFLADISDARAPVILAELSGLAGDVQGLAFSPDSSLLAAGGRDEAVYLWDVTDPAAPVPVDRPLTGPHGALVGVAFSPDGRFVAAAGVDRSVWIWDVERGEVWARFESPGQPVYAIAFSPDGRHLAAAGGDPTVRVWTLDEEEAAAQICAMVGDPINADEWADHVPGRRFDPPCVTTTPGAQGP